MLNTIIRDYIYPELHSKTKKIKDILVRYMLKSQCYGSFTIFLTLLDSNYHKRYKRPCEKSSYTILNKITTLFTSTVTVYLG